MLDVLQGFVHELRAAGLPVSMTENLDAMRAVEHIRIDDREMFRAVLARDAGEAPPPPARVRHRLRRLLLAVSAAASASDGDDGEGADGESREESGGVPGQQGSGGAGEGMSTRSSPRCSSPR